MDPHVFESRLEEVEAERDRLEARVSELESLLFSHADVLPVEWGLTPAETRIVCALMARDVCSKEHLLAVAHDGRTDEPPEIKIVDVFICKVRKKLVPHGITISTLWGAGYRLDDRDGVKARALGVRA